MTRSPRCATAHPIPTGRVMSEGGKKKEESEKNDFRTMTSVSIKKKKKGKKKRFIRACTLSAIKLYFNALVKSDKRCGNEYE